MVNVMIIDWMWCCFDADVPDPPRFLNVDTIYHDSVMLTWKPPMNDGGGFITQYIVEKLEKGMSNWLRCCTTRYTWYSLLYLNCLINRKFILLHLIILGNWSMIVWGTFTCCTNKYNNNNILIINIFELFEIPTTCNCFGPLCFCCTSSFPDVIHSRFAHCTVEGLSPSHDYQFRVIAENLYGRSEACEPTSLVQTVTEQEGRQKKGLGGLDGWFMPGDSSLFWLHARAPSVIST